MHLCHLVTPRHLVDCLGRTILCLLVLLLFIEILLNRINLLLIRHNQLFQFVLHLHALVFLTLTRVINFHDLVLGIAQGVQVVVVHSLVTVAVAVEQLVVRVGVVAHALALHWFVGGHSCSGCWLINLIILINYIFLL